MSCFVHVSTGSVLCLVHAFMENLEMRHLVSGSGFQAFLISASKQCTATGTAFSLRGGGKQIFLLRMYLQMAFIPFHCTGSKQQHERSKACSTGGKDT